MGDPNGAPEEREVGPRDPCGGGGEGEGHSSGHEPAGGCSQTPPSLSLQRPEVWTGDGTQTSASFLAAGLSAPGPMQGQRGAGGLRPSPRVPHHYGHLGAQTVSYSSIP